MLDFMENLDRMSGVNDRNKGCKNTMENMVLEPCPCCGSTTILRYSYDPYDGYQGNLTRYIVRCNGCGLNIERPTFTDVTAAWNKRQR